MAAIVSCSDDAILSCTLDGQIETWNAAAERTLGFSAEEAIGKSIAILAPVDRLIEYRQILGKIGSGQSVNGIEMTRQKKNGQQIDVSLSVSPIKDAAGDVIGAAAVVLDITNRKRAEEALRNSEEQYRLLFDTNPVPMWVFDRATLRFLAVNQAAILQYGYTETEFLAMTVADIRPEEEIPELVKKVARCTRGLQVPNVSRHRRKNGDIIDVEVIWHDRNFHGTNAILVVAYDVTARNRSEEALLFKTALLEAQSESTIDGILVVDESDHIILANNQFGLHFGIPSELLASRDDRKVRSYVTEQVESPDAFIEKVRYLNKHQHEKSRDEIKFKNGRSLTVTLVLSSMQMGCIAAGSGTFATLPSGSWRNPQCARQRKSTGPSLKIPCLASFRSIPKGVPSASTVHWRSCTATVLQKNLWLKFKTCRPSCLSIPTG